MRRDEYDQSKIAYAEWAERAFFGDRNVHGKKFMDWINSQASTEALMTTPDVQLQRGYIKAFRVVKAQIKSIIKQGRTMKE